MSSFAGGKFRVGLVQMSCSASTADNLEKAVARVRQAARRGAQIICLQELFRSQYFCQEEEWRRHDLAEEIPGPSTETLSKIAAETKTVVIVPVFEKRGRGLHHNSAAILDAGGSLAGVYRKMHIPDDPLYHEKYYFAPGDQGFPAFQTRYARIAVLICWDQWYPEGARIAALNGADILFFPTAIGWHPDEKRTEGKAQRDAWLTMQRSHAVANGVYAAAANRVGHENTTLLVKGKARGKGIEFWGSSFVCGPQGEILKQATTGREEIVIAECDPARICLLYTSPTRR